MSVFKNFDSISFLRGYCYSVIPLVYTDSLSYMEILCKVREKVNELIENNNKLPGLISEIVEKFLESKEFESLIQSIVSGGVLNVKFPPEGLESMIGDGVTNDTKAFQEIIKYASNHDKCIFVPAGSYLLNNIVLPTGLGIYGECRGAVKFYQAGGQTGVFFTLSGENGMRNITLDCVKFNKTAEVHALSATYSSIIDCAVVDGFTGALIADGCFVQNLHCADNNEDVIISGAGNTLSCDGIVHDNGAENTWIDSNTTNFGSNDVVLNPIEPITYRTPITFTEFFKTIPMKDYLGENYNVLVGNENTEKISYPIWDTPENHGGVGDGVVDDTNAINAALQVSKFVVLRGKYKTTGLIVLNEGCTLMGVPGSEITPIGIVNENAVLCYPGSHAINLTIDGRLDTSTNLFGGINVANNAYAIDCVVKNVTGFCFAATFNSILTRCQAIGSKGQCGFYINYDGEANTILDNCVARDCYLDGVILDSSNVMFRNCTFIRNGVNPTTSGALGACGIYTETLCHNISVIGCLIEDNGEYGIVINGTLWIVEGCTVKNNGLSGISLVNSANSVISANAVSQNGKNPTTDNPSGWRHSGISIFDSYRDSITGNNICDLQADKTQVYGIDLVENKTRQLLLLSGNVMSYNKTGNINGDLGVSAVSDQNFTVGGETFTVKLNN